MSDEGKLSRRDFLKIGAAVGVGAALIEAGERLAKLMGSPSEVEHQQQKVESIVATAESADPRWEELMRNGFPRKAVESAVNIFAMEYGNEYVRVSSGSVVNIKLDDKEYQVMLTVKHALKGISQDKLMIGWVRPGNIPNAGSGVVANVGVGVIGDGEEGLAVLVCGQKSKPPFEEFFGGRVFGLEDLAFEEYQPEGKKIYGVDFSYPAAAKGKAHVVVGEKVWMNASGNKPFVDDAKLWHIERTQLEGGGSGMGVVDEDSRFIGVVESSYGYKPGDEIDFSYYPGFVPLPLVGRENFVRAIREAVADLNKKEVVK